MRGLPLSSYHSSSPPGCFEVEEERYGGDGVGKVGPGACLRSGGGAGGGR